MKLPVAEHQCPTIGMSKIEVVKPDTLSVQETKVKELLIQGLRGKEIAKALNITAGTVKFHKTSIFNKLGVKTSLQVLHKELEYYKNLTKGLK